MSPHLAIDRQAIEEFCGRRSITEFALFGSVVRDDFGPESDLDVLVTFAPEARISLFDLVRMEDELTGLLGRKVDLVTKEAVLRSHNRVRRKAILESAEVLYGA